LPGMWNAARVALVMCSYIFVRIRVDSCKFVFLFSGGRAVLMDWRKDGFDSMGHHRLRRCL
jgi:hypothetical protein